MLRMTTATVKMLHCHLVAVLFAQCVAEAYCNHIGFSLAGPNAQCAFTGTTLDETKGLSSERYFLDANCVDLPICPLLYLQADRAEMRANFSPRNTDNQVKNQDCVCFWNRFSESLPEQENKKTLKELRN